MYAVNGVETHQITVIHQGCHQLCDSFAQLGTRKFASVWHRDWKYNIMVRINQVETKIRGESGSGLAVIIHIFESLNHFNI